jgi:hypothetical protein
MKKNKLPSIISILVLTLLTILLWITLSVYRAFITKPTASVPEEVSAPLTPTLDANTIKQIEGGVYLTGSEIPDNVTGSPLPLGTPVPLAPTASPSASPNASPSATPAISQ